MRKLRQKQKLRRFPLTILLLLAALSLYALSGPLANVGVVATGISSQTTLTTPPLSTSTSTQTVTTVPVYTSTTTTLTTATSTSTTSTSTTSTSTSSSISYTSTRTETFTSTSTSTSYFNTVGLTVKQTATTTTSIARSISTYTLTSSTQSIGTTCPVAFATTGNALEPYANILRNFRDRLIMNTTAGRDFMPIFNGWYYSWAPGLAYAATTNAWVGDLVRIGVYPLIGILYASFGTYELLQPVNTEAGALMAGVVAASLLGLVYVAPVAYLGVKVLRVNRKLVQLGRSHVKLFGLWTGMSLPLLAAAYLSGSGALMSIATANLTLSTLSLGCALGVIGLRSVQMPLSNVLLSSITLRRNIRN
ncbi:MAG: CFI-box-CTERM domain-containing protein [Candidatus Bathyarchaeia archaeon]